MGNPSVNHIYNCQVIRCGAIDGSFAAAAPTLWNVLPQEIRQSQNINVFKCLLKTHLFRLAYNVGYLIALA